MRTRLEATAARIGRLEAQLAAVQTKIAGLEVPASETQDAPQAGP